MQGRPISFDTHKFVKDLRESAIPELQAEIFVCAQQEILESTLLTKRDLDRVEIKLDKLDAKFENEVALLRWIFGTRTTPAIANFEK